MRLVCALITHNRLAYTQRTLKSFLETVDVPYYLVIVDNMSTDGTTEWLKTQGHHLVQNDENFYPGRATNIGWANGVLNNQDAEYLMRLDNDMEFSPNWASKALEYFDAIQPLGQLGLDYSALDTWDSDDRYLATMGGKTINAWPGNVGGPCIIRKDIYQRGARYDETPWHDDRQDPHAMITPQEDVKFSLLMHNYGFIYGHATEKLAWTFATPDTWSEYPEYYEKTMKERGYDNRLPR